MPITYNPNKLGMRIIDPAGVVHDWEEVMNWNAKKGSDMIQDSRCKVDTFKYNSELRDLLIRASRHLGCSTSFVLGAIPIVKERIKDLEKLVKKPKKDLPSSLLSAPSQFSPAIDPLPQLCTMLSVQYYDMPEAVERLVDQYNALAIQAQQARGMNPKIPIVPSRGSKNPFVLTPYTTYQGMELDIVTDIRESDLTKYRTQWYHGSDDGFPQVFFTNLMPSALPVVGSDLTMQLFSRILQDLINVMYGHNDAELDNLNMADSMGELVELGFVDTQLPPPHLTQKGLAMRLLILQISPHHANILHRLTTNRVKNK